MSAAGFGRPDRESTMAGFGCPGRESAMAGFGLSDQESWLADFGRFDHYRVKQGNHFSKDKISNLRLLFHGIEAICEETKKRLS